MITIQEAIDILQSHVPEPKIELRKTYDSIGYYLAYDVYSHFDSPNFDNSAMDGYALCLEDTENFLKSPKETYFEVIGSSLAGVPFESYIPKGYCVQINTGAKIPQNTGCVVPIEEVEYIDSEKKKIKVKNIKKMFQNIRKKGEEVNKGQVLFAKNTYLKPNIISFLLHCGVYEVFVYKKPKVLLLTTGNELVSYKEGILEEDINKGKIVDINSFNLESSLKKHKIEVIPKFQIKDQKDEIYKTIATSLDEVDIIIITGGVSIGPYDFVKSDVERLDFSTIFWKIKQKPGKPFFFARKQNKLLFGLPGNPVSTFLSFQHYVLPLILYYDSRIWVENKIVLQSKESFENSGERDGFYTIIKEKEKFSFYKKQGSHMFSSIAYSDGYTILKSGQQVKPGDELDCFLWI